MAITDKQRRFVEEYLVDLNATQAAIRAGYSEDTARQQGHRLLTDADISDAVAEAQAARAARVQVTADQVLRELVDIATTDANELIEHRIGCCRFCWGRDFRYQRTRNELERAEAAHAAENEEAIRKGAETTLFDPEGGDGYHAHRPPNPDCPECFGDGVGRALFKDTARASPAARRLYAGVKLTKDGMEMKLHPKLDALDRLFKHLGMSAAERVELTGKDGAGLVVEIVRFGENPASE
ncbi:terminase small subunit [uncultured Methylobacterium sp.]|uniref:terminase small subunit n=1 Tax=uncultured Methylobacterium sp. TaxID=157278 RepID=UPI0035CC34A9